LDENGTPRLNEAERQKNHNGTYAARPDKTNELAKQQEEGHGNRKGPKAHDDPRPPVGRGPFDIR
jgi:hypothetical protein